MSLKHIKTLMSITFVSLFCFLKVIYSQESATPVHLGLLWPQGQFELSHELHTADDSPQTEQSTKGKPDPGRYFFLSQGFCHSSMERNQTVPHWCALFMFSTNKRGTAISKRMQGHRRHYSFTHRHEQGSKCFDISVPSDLPPDHPMLDLAMSNEKDH